jgi:hypothetical protein
MLAYADVRKNKIGGRDGEKFGASEVYARISLYSPTSTFEILLRKVLIPG